MFVSQKKIKVSVKAYSMKHISNPFANRQIVKLFFHFFIISLFYSLTACTTDPSTDYIPKPKGYPRIDLPAQTYQPLDDSHPYSFEYSTSAVILPDTFAKAEPHWIFISYPAFKANIQLTYKPVLNDSKKLSSLINDAYKLAGWHRIRASGIREFVIETNAGQKAVLLELSGEVPSYLQFFTTDTTTHYLRGAMYFSVAGQQDSLNPVIDYLKADMIHLLMTLKWKKNKSLSSL
jgi:gliding motility-associated lipoprotein GldD